MSKLAATLKAEISRLARRELKKSAIPMRAEMIALRREFRQQRERLLHLEKSAAAPSGSGSAGAAAAREPAGPGPRLNGKTIRSTRKRLGLSQVEFAKIAGVTPVAVYLWESGRTNPRGRSRVSLLEIRKLGAREARRRLEETPDRVVKHRGKRRAKASAGRRPRGRRAAG